MINIKGMDKAKVLAALYNHSIVQGLGVLQARPGDMTVADARRLIEDGKKRGSLYFDYVYGRVLKVDLSRDNEFDERLYDRDLGDGAAWAAIASIT